MQGNFGSLPRVDHLKEGVHYRIVGSDFAAASPVSHVSGTPCPEGYKMIFGICRKLKAGSQDWDRGSKSDQEKTIEGEGAKTSSTTSNNKAITSGGKKYGWAMLGEKPIVVEWGSVAGIKNPDGTITKPNQPQA